MDKIRLRLLWHPQPQFAGALVAQHEGIAARHGIALDCQPMSFEEGPVDAVLNGNAEMCIASPSHLLESRDPGALSYILTIQQDSPLIYPALTAHGVQGLADLAGKRIAVWPGGEDLELRWMLARAGLGGDAVDLVPTGDTVGALLAGEVTCAQMTDYHEYPEYLEKGGRAGDVVAFRARDTGQALLKDGLIARRDWLARHPETAQATVNALLEGWGAALSDRAATIALCRRLRPDLDEAHQALQYDRLREIILVGNTLTHGLGYPAPDHLTRPIRAMHETGEPEPGAPAEDFLDGRFWAAAPQSLRRRAW